ncbi:MAG: phytanoyl-CoA dioxygenase family protein [Bacteroidetes bacterium]|nr:phytanoyl-CoA dioxygenase family protein [Bacteroidota bacterium]
MSDLGILDRSYEVTRAQIDFYRENGYIKLKDVLPRDVIDHFDRVISEEVARLTPRHLPMAERDTYGKAFLQVTNIWRQSEAVRRLVFSRRLARIASILMEVDGVRLYHDQALYKEAGGGYTPWHADQYYWPLQSSKTTTAWVPLQETTLDMGALEFSPRSQCINEGRDLAISKDSEALIEGVLSRGEFAHVIEPFEIGELSFHSGRLYHRAAPNRTDSPRRVICIIYMDAEMRLMQPENNNQQLDWETWCPGAKIGEVIDTPLNPILYRS